MIFGPTVGDAGAEYAKKAAKHTQAFIFTSLPTPPRMLST